MTKRKPRGRRPTPNTKAKIRKWMATYASPDRIAHQTRKVG